jgi:Protein of unknown function (DUF2855)
MNSPTSTLPSVSQLWVNKKTLSHTLTKTLPRAPLAAGQLRVAVDSFALTSNNITYAAFGDAMNYWGFYPTESDGWGIVPVWGFATVIDSRCEGIAVGERFYGYYPMASEAVLTQPPTARRCMGFTTNTTARRWMPFTCSHPRPTRMRSKRCCARYF